MAELGNAKAQYDLGRSYAFPRRSGHVSDPVEMVKWYEMAAEQGNADAQYELGMCWARYYGDRKDALKWLTKAAEQGDERAKKALQELKSK